MNTAFNNRGLINFVEYDLELDSAILKEDRDPACIFQG